MLWQQFGATSYVVDCSTGARISVIWIYLEADARGQDRLVLAPPSPLAHSRTRLDHPRLAHFDRRLAAFSMPSVDIIDTWTPELSPIPGFDRIYSVKNGQSSTVPDDAVCRPDS